MKLVWISLLSLLALKAWARPLSYDEKLEDLLQISTLIKSQYGPYELKKQTIKMDPELILPKYARLAKTTNDLQFFYLLNQYIAEFKDSHFGGSLPTNHLSMLGFETDLVNGKALIDTIDRNALPADKFPFERGDELVSINGVEAAKIAAELATYIGMGNPESGKRLATEFLAFRPASKVPPQYGKAEVTLKHTSTGKTEVLTMEWKQTGDDLGEFAERSADAAPQTDYRNISIDDVYAGLPQAERTFRCNGISRIKVPAGAEMIMTTPFIAYIHDTPKGKVGYLRIPHYYWKNAVTGADENELRFQQYEYVVDEMEKKTVGLVIDQDHNCGGSVLMVEKMVSLFANKPFVGLEFKFLATRNEYMQFKASLTPDMKSTIEAADLKKVLGLMEAAWKKGDRMTEKTSFAYNRLVNPNRIRYTKPVLVLTDELSGSGGDAFPAMMQGHGFAKIMGSRTMGAGGHVVEFGGLPYSANQVRMTKSLFFHPNGTPIENNGCTPDIAYAPTEKDFTSGYVDYQAKYLAELSGLIH